MVSPRLLRIVPVAHWGFEHLFKRLNPFFNLSDLVRVIGGLLQETVNTQFGGTLGKPSHRSS